MICVIVAGYCNVLSEYGRSKKSILSYASRSIVLSFSFAFTHRYLPFGIISTVPSSNSNPTRAKISNPSKSKLLNFSSMLLSVAVYFLITAAPIENVLCSLTASLISYFIKSVVPISGLLPSLNIY